MSEQAVAERSSTSGNELQVLADKLAIREVLTNYCRSVDRLDRDLALTVWHPDAKIDYPGMQTGDLEGFLTWVFDGHIGYRATNHQVTNVTIRVDGDKAVSEAYVTARIRAYPDENGRRVDMVVTGRYLDRWTRRESGWMIDERVFMNDVLSEYEVVNAFDGELPGRPNDGDYTTARRGRDDPSYSLLASIDA